jgi:hypothetical protein
MKSLNLPLESKWFDMTAQNIKKEDYREINEYWIKRLLNFGEYEPACVVTFFKYKADIKHYTKKFDTTTITKGNPKKDDLSRRRTYKHLGIEIRTGNPLWGAEPDKLYFVIMHGEEIENSREYIIDPNTVNYNPYEEKC